MVSLESGKLSKPLQGPGSSHNLSGDLRTRQLLYGPGTPRDGFSIGTSSSGGLSRVREALEASPERPSDSAASLESLASAPLSGPAASRVLSTAEPSQAPIQKTRRLCGESVPMPCPQSLVDLSPHKHGTSSWVVDDAIRRSALSTGVGRRTQAHPVAARRKDLAIVWDSCRRLRIRQSRCSFCQLSLVLGSFCLLSQRDCL